MLTVAATPDLVPFLLARMAPDEREGLERLTDGQGAARLALNIEASTLTWCGVDAEGVVTMGGVFPLASNVGYVWQVATPALRLHKRAYIRQGRAMLTTALARYERLTTDIAASYGAALRHVVRLGFDVAAPVDMGGTKACRCHLERRF